jgi:hexokinase
VSVFLAEMRAGLDGRASSLEMIPTYLSPGGTVRDNETALAVDIGGTNLRIALVKASNRGLEIAASDVSPVPGTRGELTKEAFLQQVAGKMLPFTWAACRVGVCFSHSAEILPNRDGRLHAFSKEVRVTGASGMEICRELSGTLARMGAEPMKQFVLLNDTAAVLLSNAGGCYASAAASAVGFVLGTGMNISYVEKADSVRKAAGLFSGDAMIVNTEAGGFDKLPFGALDAAFFETTADPAEHRLEKITAGRYLGELILFALGRAADEGVLGGGAADGISALRTLTTPETSDFLADPHGSGALSRICGTDSDRAAVSAVINGIYDRAARHSAAAIAAVLRQTDAGRLAGRPACVTAEGSTFYKLHSFREKFDRYVRKHIVRHDGRHLEVVSVENATILGTALAAMTQE